MCGKDHTDPQSATSYLGILYGSRVGMMYPGPTISLHHLSRVDHRDKESNEERLVLQRQSIPLPQTHCIGAGSSRSPPGVDLRNNLTGKGSVVAWKGQEICGTKDAHRGQRVYGRNRFKYDGSLCVCAVLMDSLVLCSFQQPSCSQMTQLPPHHASILLCLDNLNL